MRAFNPRASTHEYLTILKLKVGIRGTKIATVAHRAIRSER